jgi:hypothetical protein
VAALGDRDPGLLEADPGRVRDGADADKAMAAGHGGAVPEGDDDAVLGAFHRLGARAGQHRQPAAFEDALQDLGGVGVRAGQHPVAAGDQGDLGAQAVVGGGEFGAGDTGTDHDELFGQFVQIVDLGPVQDADAVRPGGGEFPRVGADRQQDRVGLDDFGAVDGEDLDGVVVQHPAGADEDPDALLLQSGPDVVGLLPCQAQQAVVDVFEVRAHDWGEFAAVDVELDAQLAGLAHAGHQVRRRDQGLGRHDVGQHRGAAEAGAFDDGDLRTE